MKRFLAFYGDEYYPNPGMIDFVGDYETFEEAVNSIEKKHIEMDRKITVWGAVYDSVTRTQEHIEVK